MTRVMHVIYYTTRLDIDPSTRSLLPAALAHPPLLHAAWVVHVRRSAFRTSPFPASCEGTAQPSRSVSAPFRLPWFHPSERVPPGAAFGPTLAHHVIHIPHDDF